MGRKTSWENDVAPAKAGLAAPGYGDRCSHLTTRSLVVLHETWVAPVYMAASFISSSSGELGVHCGSLVRCTMLYLLLLGVFACVYIGKGQTKSEVGGRRQWLCRELTSEPESGSSASLWWLVSLFLCFCGALYSCTQGTANAHCLSYWVPWRKQLEIWMWSGTR